MADYYLVDLIADEQTLELTPLDSIAALSRYFEEEGADRDGERDLVLTKGSSKEKLAKLYPNYFGDISDLLSSSRRTWTRSLKAHQTAQTS